MQDHRSRAEGKPRQMRMPGYDIQEIDELDPKDAFQLAELGGILRVQTQGVVLGEGERVDGGLGHHVAELTPERLALGRGDAESSPGSVCKGGRRQEDVSKGEGDDKRSGEEITYIGKDPDL